MAIKDKEGKVYQLRGPNPIMQTQIEWDRNQLIFHNFDWKNEVISDERNPIKEFKKKTIDIGEELELKSNKNSFVKAKEFIDEIKEKPVESPKEKPNVVTINVDDRSARLLKERGVEYLCIPVVDYKVHRDELYGNSYTTPIYGDKITLDAIIIAQSDLQLQFWCMKSISKDSVVYQKVKEGEWERRWWRVENVEPKTGGFMVLLHTSDSNPDFS